jgi:hypothetical protein
MTSQRRDTRIDQFFDQLLAQLRESPTPLTTREVAAGVRARRIALWSVRGGLTAHVGDTVRGATSSTWSPSPHQPEPSTTTWPRLPRGMVQRLNGIPWQPHRPLVLSTQRRHRLTIRCRRS